jgi:hypothetical protein
MTSRVVMDDSPVALPQPAAFLLETKNGAGHKKADVLLGTAARLQRIEQAAYPVCEGRKESWIHMALGAQR